MVRGSLRRLKLTCSGCPRTEVPEQNGDRSEHRAQEVLSLQALTKRVILRFNV